MTYMQPHTVLSEAADWCARITANPLSDEETETLKTWLTRDPEHARAFRRAMGIWDSFSEEAVPPELDTMRHDALATFRRAKAQRKAMMQRVVRPLMAVAASVALVCGGLFSYSAYMSAQGDTYLTKPAERRIVVLADGSKVTLDADSAIRVHFKADSREIWLEKGRASFEVASNPMRPFSVDVDNRKIVATGTEFSVEKLNTQLRVVLYEGHVAIVAPEKSSRKTAPKVEVTLDPGQSYSLRAGGAQPDVYATDENDKGDWRNGILMFQNEPIADAVERVNRYASRPVRLEHVNRNLRISGIYKAGDVSAFMDGVSVVHGLRASTTQDEYILSAR